MSHISGLSDRFATIKDNHIDLKLQWSFPAVNLEQSHFLRKHNESYIDEPQASVMS